MTEEQKNDKERKLSEKEELEAIIAQSTDSLEYLTEEAKKLAPKKNPIVFDYDAIKEVSKTEAEDLVGSSAKFYLTADTINSEIYVQQKMRADVVVTSDLLRSLKIAEHAICKMLEQIEAGDMHPRTFEVLAGFQKTKLELTQALAKQINGMEDQYKKLKEDYKIISTETAEVIDISSNQDGVNEFEDGSASFIGTRKLLESIRSELDRKDKEDRDAAMAETIRRQERENKNRGV